MITNYTKLSELTFESVCNELGVSKFWMHVDASDSPCCVSTPDMWAYASEKLMSAFGDVDVELISSNAWYNQFNIVDASYIKAHDEYCNNKASWCARYGCD